VGADRQDRRGKATLHALRHTHVSQLIAVGLDVVTVSRRIGHSSPTVTLTVYAHLFGNTDEKAAASVETALAGALARLIGVARRQIAVARTLRVQTGPHSVATRW
jgi:hypothetical protein